ncbi:MULTISPECIES: NAD(P)H-binding protein [Niastella]|uniref:NAD(P)H-binding protein n=1 Tax=Niastella soli TaxID=2821487 RepID=A0ABS3YLC2_9BACT|nr:NAD(P)H-binding protein [Niastella soli]MBO9198643.1 NAD(P)H-binding protein [Niastella soli]
MKVVVTGSLGNISKPLAIELVQKGHQVTIISRSTEKQEDIKALGAQAAIGSVENVDFLTQTFTGADVLYAMIPPNFSELDQVAYYRRIAINYAMAVQQSGIKQVVHLSSYGAHLEKGTGFILGAHHGERIFNELPNISITHLRAGFFYTNLYRFIDMIKGAGFMASNYGGDDKLILVHPTDIATAAREEIESQPAGKKIRYVVSDEHTANEVAHIIGTAIDKPDLKWIILSNEQMREGLEKQGMPVPLIEKFVEMGSSAHSGALGEDYERQKPIQLGKIKTEDFAKSFAEVFKKVN